MDIEELLYAVEEHLAPLLSATVSPDFGKCTARCLRIASLEPSKIAIKAGDEAEERVVIYRVPGFVPEELQLAKDFTDELFAMHDVTSPEYRADLLAFLPERAIAKHLGYTNVMQALLRQFQKWAARTYEGRAITSSIGINPEVPDFDVTIDELFEHDFATILSNGFDTLLVITENGKIAGAGHLNFSHSNNVFSPYRLNAIAEWCTENKVAVILNRLGEQLIFRNKKLIFAKRRGEWRYYAHENYIKQLIPKKSRKVKEAIYQSCLDISYARSGGCIIVINDKLIEKINELVSDEDRLDGIHASVKSKTLRSMIDKKFQDLDRRLRQEILALDGATILKSNGEIVAAGAIISVPAGSKGGGRMAAATKGSLLGMGIKISEDGEISVFIDGKKVFSF
jgi:DNA integrity scanning protein DisA with diadenylate cyclase activity